MNKQVIFVVVAIALIASPIYAACTRSENTESSSDIVDNIKCGLSSAGDSLNTGYEATKEKVKEGVSVVTSSDTFGKLSGWFSKASDSVKSAAKSAGEVISDGYTKTVEATKDGYAVVKDTIVGKPASEFRDGEGKIDVRGVSESPSTLIP